MHNISLPGGKMWRSYFLLVFIMFLLGLSPNVFSANVDSFTTGQAELVDTTTGDGALSISIGDGSDATILGGTRDSSIELLSGPLRAYMSLIDSVGFISMSVDALSTATGTIQWDGPDNSINLNTTGLQTGGVGVDLSNSGSFDAFAITKIFADHPYEFVIGVYTDATNWTEISFAGDATSTTVIDFYDFTNFTNPALCNTTNPSPGINAVTCGSQPADITNVGAVQLILDPNGNTTELDVVIDSFDFVSTAVCFANIGDKVWNDLNRNGIQDIGEPGINGVRVNLLDNSGAIIATTTTSTVNNVAGFYEFKNNCAGDYIVEVDVSTLPPNMVASPVNQSADISIDSNGSPTVVNLFNDNDSDPTIDFGYNSPCTGVIGDYVWFDANRNGIQDAGESGIAGVVVNLKNTQGIVVATATTDVNGFYQFLGLCADDYIVEVNTNTLPPGYVPSPTEQGSDPALDSNINGSLVTLLTDDDTNLSIDYGYNSACTGVIGDYIWFDANRNGIQDAGESGIAGVTVNLKDAQNIVIATTSTDVNGFYQFSGLCANDYVIEVDPSTLPPGYVPSPTEQGNDPTIDSNVNGSTVTFLTDNVIDNSFDFGFNSECTGVIGDYIWFDANRNGIQDAGESGIAGVTVNLKDAQNTVIATTTTDVNGFYQFTGLCANDYIVEVNPNTLPSEYVASPTLQGGDPSIDSNVNGSLVTLFSDNDTDATFDLGYNSPCTGTIGDYIWVDANRNGIQDAGESGIAGVTVNLKNAQNTVIATTTTDVNGFYQFSGLCANDYIVEVDPSTLPQNYVPSPTEQGNDPTIDSNVNGSLVTLFSDNDTDPTIDFAYNSACTGVIGDYIWFDANRNGIQDAGESGIAGVTVNLKDAQNTVIATTTTDVNGFYQFTGLCANDYIIEVDLNTLPPEYVSSPTEQGNDPTIDSNINGSSVKLLTDNDKDTTFDLGYNSRCTGRIGNTVWYDANRNGIQDAGENGITGVTVNLKDAQNTIIAMVTTDANGVYVFNGLCPAAYKVEVDESTLPVEYVASPVLQGSDTSVDSNVNGSVVILDDVINEDLTIDFGYNSPCSGVIGDFVWLDLNENGIQDYEEVGISNVKVTLRDSQNTEIATTMTDSNGFYQFVGICLGAYRVEIDPNTLPDGLTATISGAGPDGAFDSNGSPADVILPGDFETDTSIDFGYIEKLIPDNTCKYCDGKVTQLTLQYNGKQAAWIKVVQKKGKVVFNAMVQPGEHFTFSGQDRKGTLGTEITIYVDGQVNAKIHTSCSVAIGPGFIAGGFEVIEAYSRNGGLMCPVEEPSVCKGDKHDDDSHDSKGDEHDDDSDGSKGSRSYYTKGDEYDDDSYDSKGEDHDDDSHDSKGDDHGDDSNGCEEGSYEEDSHDSSDDEHGNDSEGCKGDEYDDDSHDSKGEDHDEDSDSCKEDSHDEDSHDSKGDSHDEDSHDSEGDSHDEDSNDSKGDSHDEDSSGSRDDSHDEDSKEHKS